MPNMSLISSHTKGNNKEVTVSFPITTKQERDMALNPTKMVLENTMVSVVDIL